MFPRSLPGDCFCKGAFFCPVREGKRLFICRFWNIGEGYQKKCNLCHALVVFANKIVKME